MNFKHVNKCVMWIELWIIHITNFSWKKYRIRTKTLQILFAKKKLNVGITRWNTPVNRRIMLIIHFCMYTRCNDVFTHIQQRRTHISKEFIAYSVYIQIHMNRNAVLSFGKHLRWYNNLFYFPIFQSHILSLFCSAILSSISSVTLSLSLICVVCSMYVSLYICVCICMCMYIFIWWCVCLTQAF